MEVAMPLLVAFMMFQSKLFENVGMQEITVSVPNDIPKDPLALTTRQDDPVLE